MGGDSMAVVRVKGNRYTRFLSLKRHVKFIWNCANGQVDVARAYGKLTKDDYLRFGSINWGKHRKE
jgi:hypothetical protein